MKKIIIFLLIILAYSNEYAQNILGEKYFKYQKLITTSLEKNASLKDTIIFLENNGLINLNFKKKKLIHPTFIFLDNNSFFNTKTLYDSLENLGYLDYFPCEVKKNSNYSITLELFQNHFINPLNIINEFEKRGCKIIDLAKDKDFIYYISCKNEKILNAYNLSNKLTLLHNIKGIFWIKVDSFNKIYIKNFIPFYPYITFFDKNLNIIRTKAIKNYQKRLVITIPQNTFYIKIQDYFTNANLKRGLFIKGLK